ncbi:DUF4190 domain-containing protein [Hamadaea tsunoensis]|uniref:DUF4190 domain-containing protein n=1 Tax=Hamadaea tsunoensis TaxID=53368 RepID=UPI0004067309|nr:DUF4190 domain-containing protein [Hamadaea tsunoensis]
MTTPQPSPYGPPYVPVPGRPTNGLAIGALITSIACFFICLPAGIAGAIMGHVARRQIRERGEDGDGLALAAIILGWVGFVLMLAVVLLFVAFFVWGVAVFPSDPGPTYDGTVFSSPAG